MYVLRTMFLIAAITLAASDYVLAQDADIQAVYATSKGACGSGPRTRVEITGGRISGPGFDCALSNGRPAGTGLVAYDASCTVDGKKRLEGLALDLGNHTDHFELSLPGRDGWIELYPCTPVPGLKSGG